MSSLYLIFHFQIKEVVGLQDLDVEGVVLGCDSEWCDPNCYGFHITIANHW